jgi:hypothetical protein
MRNRRKGTVKDKNDKDANSPILNGWKRAEVYFAGVVAAFTIVLSFLAWKQWQTSRMLERAYMIETSTNIVHMEPGQKPMIRIDFENGGRTVATLIESEIIVKKVAQLPSEPDYSAATPSKMPSGIQVEATKPFILASNDENPLTPEEKVQIDKGAINYYAFGYLAYKDIFGKEHRTGFCCYWNRAPVYENVTISPLYCAEPNYQYAN